MTTPARPVVLVTGLSGAGRSSILHHLEDLGFETVDNPPLDLLEELVGDGAVPLAAGIDARSRGFDPAQVLLTLARLRLRPDIAVTLVFATAETAVLQRRYSETRRRHPLAPGGPLGNRVTDGIAREQALLAPLQEAADMVVDTSDLPLPDLRQLIERLFRREETPGLLIHVRSFGFPHGLPRDAELVFDVRFLRNPHYDPALRPLTGRDPAVAAHVEADPDFAGFWQRLTGFIDPLLPRYVAEGKKYLTVALGCTGGRHRSVLVAERLADHLRGLGWRADVTHRELDDTAATPGGSAPGGSPASAAPLAHTGGREALTPSP
ncbi:RNase adapter RapZ [Paeniroseomonas aquatica]|uniref:RNase adapter RapZ n=1 Tax=Paeniroseomonas aquatica TaxID=373043 RepID=A0ABT8AGG9_9PROT|nr:RNase adapter RapZ [Paeniroseomonas aquatica]MDN3568922.1 RNase adapter RapZ [Paeniroseomonas aquatica]